MVAHNRGKSTCHAACLANLEPLNPRKIHNHHTGIADDEQRIAPKPHSSRSFSLPLSFRLGESERSSLKNAVSPAVTHTLVGPTPLVRFARSSILEQDASTLIASSSDPLTTGINFSDANGSGRIRTCMLHTVLTSSDVLKRLMLMVGSIFVCQRFPHAAEP